MYEFNHNAGQASRRPLLKILMIMKLTVFFMVTISLLRVSASSYGQNITLHEKNATLTTIFNKIRSQTEYDFVFTATMLKNSRPVTIDVVDANLQAVMEKIFEKQSLSFTIESKTIILRPLAEKQNYARDDDYGDISGTVTDISGKPLSAASVLIETSPSSVVSTGSDGAYRINKVPIGRYKVTVTYIGYKTEERFVVIASKLTRDVTISNFVLEESTSKLSEVVVSTGYQTLPKERATGSFEKIDNKLFNRSPSANLIDRLNGIASGVQFNNINNGTNTFQGAYTQYPQGSPQFSVRGLSTIVSYVNSVATTSEQPLVVLDNFPYTGDINSINPNDVESITILKDAAAASIWGARAGNGVVVITTKKGSYGQKPIISFNANLTTSSKPDLFSQRQISTADYIDVERNLFGQGFYDAFYNTDPNNNFNGGKDVSEVIKTLFALRAGTLSQSQADARITSLASNDVRNDLKKYFFDNALNQQYSLSVRGGGQQQRYYISAGYDDNKAVNYSALKRFTLSAGTTFSPFKNLEVNIPLYFTNNKTMANRAYDSNVSSISPYSNLVDANGHPVNVTVPNGYSPDFINKVKSAGLYDLGYNPISELNAGQYVNISTTQIRINPELKYVFPFGITASMQYQHSRALTDERVLQDESTFYVRNLLNQYAQISPSGDITYPINKGGILRNNNTRQIENFLRTSLGFNRDLGADHRIDILAGYESNETTISNNLISWYGYNAKSGAIQSNVDYNSTYPNTLSRLSGLPFDFNNQIPQLDQGIGEQFNAYRSAFVNGSYTYKKKYIVSGSARIDQANLYGVNTNLRKKALWSIGGSWNINEEHFYHVEWLPVLKLRATYGYQGNPPTSAVTSLATIFYYSPTQNSSGLPFASLTGLPNADLTWEKIGQMNLGLDFGFKNNRFAGSVEYYRKRAKDLIATYLIDPTLGASSRTANSANMEGKGVDVTLNGQPIISGDFRWDSRFLISYNADNITKYLTVPTVNATLNSRPSPIEGNAVYGLYSYKWGGLDAQGNPQGYDSKGALSTNYNDLVNNTNVENLEYNGRLNPKIYGSFLNSFSYKNLSLSANVTYEAGYYFRAASINYSTLYGSNMLGSVTSGADYEKRWQKAGDENTTYVPSAPALADLDYYRDVFYQQSAVLVQKGDHVRLKDITASYNFNTMNWMKRGPFNSLEVYCYYSPNVIIWRANKLNIDPIYQSIKPVRNLTFGIRASLK